MARCLDVRHNGFQPFYALHTRPQNVQSNNVVFILIKLEKLFYCKVQF